MSRYGLSARAKRRRQAEEVCAAIRNVVAGIYDEKTALGMTIQYGGSMNAKNADELLSMKDIDGGLIGGAALKAEDFHCVCSAARAD